MSGRRDHDEDQSPNLMNQEERFLSRLLSKEDSRVHSSSRVYYYGGAAVPFVWETSPGTPKHTLFVESSRLPPLTPPPSYYSSSGNLSVHKRNNNNLVKSKQNNLFLATLFRLNKSNSSLKNHVSPTFSWSSTSSSLSSSSSSPFSSPSPASSKKVVIFMKKCRPSCSRSPVPYVSDDSEVAEKDKLGSSSPTSTLCYRSKRRDFRGGKRGFGSSLETMKRALISVLSHGSNGQDLIDDDPKN